MTANDKAWGSFFAKTKALDEIRASGYTYVSAQKLKAITGREPRLLAKQDTLRDRPSVFKDHSLTIFPVKNGEYVIFRDLNQRTYFQFDDAAYQVMPEQYASQIDLFAFDAFPGIQRLNESQALDFAYVSSLLRQFTGDSDLHLVIRGRTYTGTFGFALPNSDHFAKVGGVQIEVDGGYESRDAVYLFEAKVGARTDFHIRQLYYPYLEWSSRSKKRIVPIFLVYTNGKFHFFEFKFTETFGDLGIERAACYVVDETPLARIRLTSLLSRTPLESEPPTPFPQANDLDKIVDLAALIEQNPADKRTIAAHFEFDERQGDYYANAAVYLGLAEREAGGFVLTDLGRRFIANRSLAVRNELLVEQMLKRPVFREVLVSALSQDMKINLIPRGEIAAKIRQYTNLSGNTPWRRASTVERWLAWIQQNCEFEP